MNIRNKKFLCAALITGFSGVFVFYILPFAWSFFAVFIETDSDGQGISPNNLINIFKSSSFVLALKYPKPYTKWPRWTGRTLFWPSDISRFP
ncbi:MAG: hypothetical protein FWG34_09445 [Oscillospiraceae bacterium]|nr:hypothetical protein [Oscillospiraceae bacterium]